MKCLYRNCEKIFDGRPNKKFCCTRCKRNEAKYRKRYKIKNEIKNGKEINMV